MRTGICFMLLIFLMIFAMLACNSTGDSDDDRQDYDGDEAGGEDQHEGDNTGNDTPNYTDDGQSCTLTLECRDLLGQQALCFEWGDLVNCLDACMSLSTDEGTKEGQCVSQCNYDTDCPDGYFCEPVCAVNEERPTFCLPQEEPYLSMTDCD